MRDWRIICTGLFLVLPVLSPNQAEDQELEASDPPGKMETAAPAWRSPVRSSLPLQSNDRTDTLNRFFTPPSGASIGSATSYWQSLRRLYGHEPLETPPERARVAPPPEKVEPITRSNLRKVKRNKGYFMPLGDTLLYYDRSGKNRGYRKATSIYRSAYSRSSVSLGDTSRSARVSRSSRRDAGRTAQSRR